MELSKMMMSTGPQGQYMRQKDYRYCQHHNAAQSQQMGPGSELVFPMIVNPEQAAARASNIHGSAGQPPALALSPVNMGRDVVVDPVRTSIPAIRQMLAAKLYPGGFPIGPLYVNEKQYYRILKRRQVRLKLNNKRKSRSYMHESRHKHAMNRPRGPGGRFLSSSNNSKDPGGASADTNIENDNQLARRERDQDQNVQDTKQQENSAPPPPPPPLDPQSQIRQVIQPPPPHQQDPIFQPQPIDLNAGSYCIDPSSSSVHPSLLPQDHHHPPSGLPMQQTTAQSLMSSLSVPDHTLNIRKGV